MSTRLSTRGLTKVFGVHKAVDDVAVSFERARIHAVLGENGAGKSTLMKLLFGLHTPTSGEVLVNDQPVRFRSSADAIAQGLGMVQQHFSLVENISVIDNVMLGAEVHLGLGRLARGRAIEKLEGLLPSHSLRLPWMAPVYELTVGQKQKLEILKLLFRKSDILVLDEPTAVLAPLEIEELFTILRELKAQGRTILLVTHKINEVLALCDTYSVLRRGCLVGRGLVRDASAGEIVELMMGRQIPAMEVERRACGEKLALSVRAVTDKHENGPRERGGLRGLDLEVRVGEIVGVAGVEGSGQSQLVEALFGLRDCKGEIDLLGERVRYNHTRDVRDRGVGLVPEDRLEQAVWMNESVFTNLMVGLEARFLQNGIFRFDDLKSSTQGWAKDFDVRAASLDVPIKDLSGGNQQKVVFARELTGRAPKFLVCHQPTRGVDLGAIDLIHRRLIEMRNQGLAILMISHELDELLAICDRILVFYEGRVAAQFERADFDRLKIGAAMTGAANA